MKIFHSRHTLTPFSSLTRRVGSAPRPTALLKIEFESGAIGFSNLHTNHERLGTTLDQELQGLAIGKPSPQARRSIELARLDAEARAAGRSLWDGLEVPPCHYLVTELSEQSFPKVQAALQKGFRKVKIKTGRNLEQEVRFMNRLAEEVPAKSLRPDFNQALSLEQLRDFVRLASPRLVDALDFVEDPTEDHPRVWYEASPKIPWAWDQYSERVTKEDKGFRAVITKPALQQIDLMWSVLKELNVQISFTCYMDHPVGQLGATLIAAMFYKQHPEKKTECGLICHHLFEPTAYSKGLAVDGPQLIPPPGPGIGFGELLEKEDWKELTGTSPLR